MEIPAPIVAFVASIAELDGTGWSVTYGRWRISRKPGFPLAGLAGWLPDAGSQAAKDVLGQAKPAEPPSAKETTTTARPMSDIASLALPIPEFREDPLAPDSDDRTTAPSGLTDQARAEFLAATARAVPED